jgi:hypothetical protein
MRVAVGVVFGIFLGTVLGCGGGSTGGAAGFRLIEFLESNQANIPRNRDLEFRFTAPVDPSQDLFERLKIQSVESGAGTGFAKALGVYIVTGDRVLFRPRPPELADRSDAGFRAKGQYHVYLKAGADALASASGDTIDSPEEHVFNTSEFFEDPMPNSPPRVVRLVVHDRVSGNEMDLSRADPRPTELALLDSNDLLTEGKAIEPGAGAGYLTPWEFRLHVSEALDPATVSNSTVELLEIRDDALTGATTANEGHVGDPVLFRVPIAVDVVQKLDAQGELERYVRVRVLQTLVDDARYRLVFSGSILGIDFRTTFIGANGLTGDGETEVAGAPLDEPGGLGYTTEFLVFDRPGIEASRAVTFDPLVDDIQPEAGQTTTDPALLNTALYNPASSPGTAVGFINDFGDGTDGALAVSSTTNLDTGDTPNAALGNPFTVQDLNPDDTYNKTDLSRGPLTYDSYEAFELNLEALTISPGGVLRITGVNPVLIRVNGIVQIAGTLDVSGGDGQNGRTGSSAGGEAGAGGGKGGDSRRGTGNLSWHSHTCDSFASFLTRNATARNNGPFNDSGEGPGRGLRGAESYSYGDGNDLNGGVTGTGGGGGSHATRGTAGEDRRNVNGSLGTHGPACGHVHSTTIGGFYNEGVIGARGEPGPTYGDPEILDVTWGGSGGGAGGSVHGNPSWSQHALSGGAGGGGGGSVAVLASGDILVPGGEVDASGGDGGQGGMSAAWTSNYRTASGAGGGGAGGSITMISASNVDLTAGLLNAAGGQGGARSNSGSNVSCNGCNAGGAGGNGFIFLMDPDGSVGGRTAGTYDDPLGVTTVSEFELARFSTLRAVTMLFGMPAADPAYEPLQAGDVVGVVHEGQTIRLFASSAKADLEEPLIPDLGTEIAGFEVALVRFEAGATVVDVTAPDLTGLNPDGGPARDAFARIRADYAYANGVEAAVGPFAYLDEVTLHIAFNS